MCISPAISRYSRQVYVYPEYTPIQEVNYINGYKPIFHTKQSFSSNNHAYLHYYY